MSRNASRSVEFEKRREHRTLISSIVLPGTVLLMMLSGMGAVVLRFVISAPQQVSGVGFGLWPIHGLGPLPFMLGQ